MIPVTFLNTMAGPDLAEAARLHRELGVSVLDLKDRIFGKGIEDLTPEEAAQAGRVIGAAGCSVYCLSSCIGYTDLADGEAAYAERHLAAMRRLLATADVLRPTVVRLLAPRVPQGVSFAEAMTRFGWVIGVFQKLVDLADAAGFDVRIENEAHLCLLTSAEECVDFLRRINRPRRLRLIYDVQNLWQMGTFPSVAAVKTLSPILGGLHLKGGQTDGGTALVTASALETASWPVLEVTRAAIATGQVPVICLNPSHGRRAAGYDTWDVAKQDLHFLRRNLLEIQGHGVST